MAELDNTTLSIVETIKTVIIGEIGGLIYPDNKKHTDIFHQSSPYIKFLPITTCIEFMGACYDELPFETSRVDKQSIVETRFNIALNKLFDNKYKPYAKASSDFYFYMKLRNSMIHQLRPGSGIVFTTRKEAKEDNNAHLNKIKFQGQTVLVLILEDFYDDLKKAAEKLIFLFETKKVTNKKGEKPFISVGKAEK